MIWSKFNILFISSKGIPFLYNSRTNVFTKLNINLHNKLLDVKNKKIEISLLSHDVIDYFTKKKVFVDNFEDSAFISQMQYLKRKKSFFNPSLELIVAPTLACNFACPYCYETNLPSNTMNENTQNQLLSFINSQKDEAKSLTINWHGGEPLIGYKAIHAIISNILGNSKIPLSGQRIVSNGYID
jgi:uncharacterized protein